MNQPYSLFLAHPEAAELWPEGPGRAALLEVLEAAGDPERALTACAEVAAARRRRAPRQPPWHAREWLQIVGRLAGASRAFAAHLKRWPRLADRLAASPYLHRPKPRQRMAYELRRRVAGVPPNAPDAPARLAGLLRRYRRLEMHRIAARDLAGWGTFEEIVAELGDLAGASFDAALSVLHPRLAAERALGPAGDPAAVSPGFCVIGMGKLGGAELNFSSDVDVLYVYDDAALPPGEAQPYFARLAELVTRALGEVTEDGFVFRVDLNLRPEGRSGPIVNSVRALEAYYEAFGRTWERQALLKARPVAGDLGVGERALEALRPFVHPRSLDLKAVQSIVALKDELDRRLRARGELERDVKLGRGGIRAVELVVQSLQLLHAGKHPGLRSRATLTALPRLIYAGLLTHEEAAALADAYVFLRRVEHRLQLVDDRQTQRLPPPGVGRLALARTMGFAGEEAETAFEAALERHRGRTQAILERRFGRTEVETDVPPPAHTALERDLEELEREQALAELGFADPAAALAHLRRLGRRPWSPFGHSASADARELASRLLADAARTPEPDQSLDHLAGFLEAVPFAAAPGLHRMLLQHPAARRVLLELFGTSDFLSRYFVRHPELLDVLILRSHARTSKPEALMTGEVAARLARHPEDDVEARLSELRRYRQEEVLRIGLADISGELDVAAVGAQLADLAAVLVRASLGLAAAWGRAEFGWPVDADGREVPLAVVGMGSLGGREMGYGSDLDLIFLFGGPGDTPGGRRGAVEAQEFFSRLAQRLISYITLPLTEGSLYDIDTRLRPSGRQGMLVTRLDAFAVYQARQAALWEKQALLRARSVAGPEDFRSTVDAALEAAAYGPFEAGPLAEAVRAMRGRIEAELGREGPGRRNPKTGRGGLVDIEFAVQFLQLRDGAVEPALRTSSTLAAIRALVRTGRLTEEDGAVFAEAHAFLRRLENRMRLARGHPGELLAGSRAELDALARRMGLPGGGPGGAPADTLLDDYDRTCGRVRAAFERLLGVAS